MTLILATGLALPGQPINYRTNHSPRVCNGIYYFTETFESISYRSQPLCGTIKAKLAADATNSCAKSHQVTHQRVTTTALLRLQAKQPRLVPQHVNLSHCAPRHCKLIISYIGRQRKRPKGIRLKDPGASYFRQTSCPS